ncbi:MAG: hypothetical protein E6230_28580 [Paenibacillus dendritiformis]|uniref:glycosyl hydrolase 2 galactose-binding domain-containing protein n=1 Tax=Paenibacillus dendritiformis TaxID=130049 RepID=UPI001FF08DFB|nr:hypothetical protein [Paenibacillus dendritiformis]MDU5146107.1 hypothetical protein [Paenibacillus dendritiformis]
MRLNENWKLRHFNIGEARDLEAASPEYIDYFWMTAKVPGDVHTTLIEKGIIEDPFYGHFRNAAGSRRRCGGTGRRSIGSDVGGHGADGACV